MRLLARLKRGETTTAAIADSMGVTLPAITRMVNALVQRKLVRREASTEDRRQSHITPTSKGESSLTTARSALRERFAEGCRQLTADERAQLLAGLDVLERLAILLNADEP
jgi:DNA-binding MarR family transcriptional regulator